nr:immunoglobulin light chain junction region [Macaca mulatta]MOV79725.1 immunoglobulin light chain junction region [Macaca mulatta]MOV82836.1 immunoglobulin light chain junction region [Macaca mulatta]
CQQYHSDSLTF